MFKKLTTCAAVTAGLAVMFLFLLGPKRCLDLLTSQRERLQERTASLVDPAVEFDSAVQQAEALLPKQIAKLKLGIQDSENELATQVQALAEIREVLALVERDLQVLAPVVVQGAAPSCELHGQRHTAEDAKQVARRLLEKKRYYAELAAAHEALIERLRQQRSQMQNQLADAATARAEFAQRARHLRAKVALVKASQKTETLPGPLEDVHVSGFRDAFAQLERRLDSALVEMDERTQLSRDLAADKHVGEVREKEMLEELAPYVAASTRGEEIRK